MLKLIFLLRSTIVFSRYIRKNLINPLLTMTRSRCGASTLSTPLSWSCARSLPSLNPGNDNTVSDTTHLPRKTGHRWEKLSEQMATYRPVPSSH
jgi:hypothetical protein